MNQVAVVRILRQPRVMIIVIRFGTYFRLPYPSGSNAFVPTFGQNLNKAAKRR